MLNGRGLCGSKSSWRQCPASTRLWLRGGVAFVLHRYSQCVVSWCDSCWSAPAVLGAGRPEVGDSHHGFFTSSKPAMASAALSSLWSLSVRPRPKCWSPPRRAGRLPRGRSCGGSGVSGAWRSGLAATLILLLEVSLPGPRVSLWNRGRGENSLSQGSFGPIRSRTLDSRLLKGKRLFAGGKDSVAGTGCPLPSSASPPSSLSRPPLPCGVGSESRRPP